MGPKGISQRAPEYNRFVGPVQHRLGAYRREAPGTELHALELPTYCNSVQVPPCEMAPHRKRPLCAWYTRGMTSAQPAWPDSLAPPNPARVATLLPTYWQTLDQLPDLIARNELLLAEALTAQIRSLVVEMMLAMNGIAPPAGTRHLNGYLGASQRTVLERTLVAPNAAPETWVARAVALTVIQSWYAPQIVERFGVEPPTALAAAVQARLAAALPTWPLNISSDPPESEQVS